MLSNFYRFLHILFLRRKKRLVHIRNRSGYEKNDSAVDDDDKVVRWIWVGVEASLVLTRTSSHGTGSETKTKLISDRVLFVDVQTMFTYTSTLLLQQLLKYRAHLKKSYHHFNWWLKYIAGDLSTIYLHRFALNSTHFWLMYKAVELQHVEVQTIVVVSGWTVGITPASQVW
jgi:hypothetical protein